MEKEFIPYEQALALKELGFDEPCFKKYIAGCLWSNPTTPEIYKNIHPNSSDCLAPLYQQAFRWFREKYGLEGVTQRAEYFMWYKWIIHQYTENVKKYVADWFEYKTYEEAELECLNKLIEIVKNK